MVLRDGRFGRDGFEQLLAAVYGGDTEAGRLPRSMLFRDPPDHTRLRALVSKAFTPKVIENMRSHIQDIVNRLLDRVQGAGRMDVIADLAYPLPVTVICEMLGVPTQDQGAIRQWSADVAQSLDAIGLPTDAEIVTRGRAARRELGEYFRRLLPERRRQPREDLVSLLIAAEEEGGQLPEGEESRPTDHPPRRVRLRHPFLPRGSAGACGRTDRAGDAAAPDAQPGARRHPDVARVVHAARTRDSPGQLLSAPGPTAGGRR